MRKEKEYRERCAARGVAPTDIDAAVAEIEALELRAGREGAAGGEVPLPLVEARLAELAATPAAEGKIMAFARYFAVLGEQQKAIRLLAYLLPIGVMPAMAARLGELEGEEVKERVMRRVSVPPEGAPPEAYPPSAAAFAAALEEELGEERARNVLRWNVHGIPAAAFAEERERFLAAPSIDAWLEDYHAREVAVLERHAASGALWYEQRITGRVVDFVRANPEIRGGRREDRVIYTTKIPYDPDRWLGSADPEERRRLACHCPFAASALPPAPAPGGSEPSPGGAAGAAPIWCSCSEGYEKFMYDVVFGVQTECRALETAVSGSELCRFAVSIPESVPLSRGGADAARP